MIRANKFFIFAVILVGAITSAQAEGDACEAEVLYTIEVCAGLPDMDTICSQSINSDCKIVDDKKCEPCVAHKDSLTIEENQDLESSIDNNEY